MPNHFDTVARDWDKDKMHLERTKAITKCFLEMVKTNKEMKALEFGAGMGLLSFALKNNFAEITLMDSSAEMIKATFEKIVYSGNHHLIPVFFDLEKKKYTEKTFDVIFSQMALHHVKDTNKVIAKFYKLLNPKGKLAIADLCGEDGSFHDMDFDGHNGFDPDQLAVILKKKGFKNIAHKRCFVIKKDSGDNTIKKYPVFLISAEK
jgi:ubiquinone/menaquinone biosynthesis C-methylase UbiE